MSVNSPRGKILVIRGGAIGDFILTLPAISALRNQFPQAHLEVLGYPHIAQLAQAGGVVDRVQSIEARALAGFFARNGNLEPSLVEYFSEFHLIVSYLFDPDEIFKTNVARCTKAQFIAGPHRPKETENIHATKVYLKPLERLAIYDADPLPRINLVGTRSTASEISPAAGAIGDAAERVPTIAVHPGSGSERKNWPEKNWAELLQRLMRSTQFNLLLVGGEAEGDKLQRLTTALSTPSPPQKEERAGVRRPTISNSENSNPITPTLSPHKRGEGVERALASNGVVSPASRIRVAQSLPLAELAGELQQCTAFIGHDSGISHLAAAVGLPGLILWGDTVEAIWRPPQHGIVVLNNSRGLSELRVEVVVVQLRKLLEA